MPEFIIPELNKVKRKFKALLSKDCSSLPAEKIVEILFDTFGSIFRPIHLNTWDTSKGLISYRVISEDDVIKYKLSDTSTKTFSYPTNPGLGRANLPGYPVLYTADNPHTAIYEKTVSDPEYYTGKSLYLSEWKMRPNTEMNTIMLLYGIIDPDHFYYEIAISIFEKMQKTMKIYSKESRKSLEFTTRALGEIFKHDHYHLSSALANHWLSTHRDSPIVHVDCLMYPSVRKAKSAVNFAFHHEFVDKQMEIVSVQKIKINDFSEQGANYTLEQLGKVNGDSVQWHTATFRVPQVDLLSPEKQVVKSYNEEEVNENIFHIYDEDVNLVEKIKVILQPKLQEDLCNTLLLQTPNPKSYPISLQHEHSFEGNLIKYLMCHVEYEYEPIKNV